MVRSICLIVSLFVVCANADQIRSRLLKTYAEVVRHTGSHCYCVKKTIRKAFVMLQAD